MPVANDNSPPPPSVEEAVESIVTMAYVMVASWKARHMGDMISAMGGLAEAVERHERATADRNAATVAGSLAEAMNQRYGV